MKTDKKHNLLRGTLFALLCTALLGLVLFSYMLGAGDTSFMDFLGWVYYLSSSLMHAALICAVPFLVVFLPLALAGVRNRISIPVLGTLYGLLILLAVVNRFVFQIYHFHINGFVLDMLFSPGAGDIFVFSFWLYVKAALILLCVAGAVVLMAWLSSKVYKHSNNHAFLRPSLIGLLAVTLLSQGLHIYGAATLRTSILEADAYLPYYFPISMNSALDHWGIIDKKQITTININESRSPLNYPLHPLEHTGDQERPNIVVIAIDSWNFRTLTPECMPNLWQFKEDNEFFANHLSSSNGTRGGIFGLFTGLSSYYWKSFEYSSLRPVLIDELVNAQYNIQLYPSATFQSPPFDRMFFKGMDSLHTSTEGSSVYERDCNLTRNFIADLPQHTADKDPFFAFLFYDLAHAIALPAEKNTRFTPAWDFADYSRLSNNTDPTPYFNLYRNCVYQIDSLIGTVLHELEERNLLRNTIVLITGDHGQEFNENHKNYWGHAGNYTKYQIQVPLILHYPHNDPGAVATYRTTHYDIVPTLLWLALGVTNPPADYSMGTFLGDTASRGWHIVGNDLNYAFITEDGHIIEKQGNGNVKTYDSALNLQPSYPLTPRQINDNLLRLNRFYKNN